MHAASLRGRSTFSRPRVRRSSPSSRRATDPTSGRAGEEGERGAVEIEDAEARRAARPCRDGLHTCGVAGPAERRSETLCLLSLGGARRATATRGPCSLPERLRGFEHDPGASFAWIQSSALSTSEPTAIEHVRSRPCRPRERGVRRREPPAQLARLRLGQGRRDGDEVGDIASNQESPRTREIIEITVTQESCDARMRINSTPMAWNSAAMNGRSFTSRATSRSAARALVREVRSAFRTRASSVALASFAIISAGERTYHR
jgi:hypothetical protein